MWMMSSVELGKDEEEEGRGVGGLRGTEEERTSGRGTSGPGRTLYLKLSVDRGPGI